MKFLNLKYAPDDTSGGGAVKQVQDQVQDTSMQPEARRKLSTVTFASNNVASFDIPRDTSVKRMTLFAQLGLTATYASGSPILSPLGLFARIAPTFTVNADGARNVKILDLYMQRCMNAIAYGAFPHRAYQTGASLLASSRQPTTEWLNNVSPAYGATAQDLIVNEQVNVDFECPYAYGRGKNVSLLYTKNLSSCIGQFQFASIDNIINTGNAAPVVYTNVDLSIVPTIVEARGAPAQFGSFDFTETVIRRQFSAQTTQFNVDLNTGNRMLGIGLMAQNGDTAKSLSDIAVTDLNLLVNGATSLQLTRFKDLMNDAQCRRGIGNDQWVSGDHALEGFAWMNLISFGDIMTGLDTRLANGLSQLQLQVSTAASTGVDAATYTNPVTLSILQQQLIPVPLKG